MSTLSIIGTRGIPNNYGGFETLAEYLAIYLSKEIEITIYCSSKDLPSKISKYHGAKLEYFYISSHGALGVIYDSICLFHAIRKSDKILILAFGCGYVIPLLKKYRNKFIINFGGLDWKRSKWTKWKQKLIKYSETKLVKYASTIVADNKLIQDYIKCEYGKKSYLIEYGGDNASPQKISEILLINYSFLSTVYALNVARIQPDNNIEMLIQVFVQHDNLKLVIVGNWNESSYGKDLKKKYNSFKNLILLDAIYDRKILDALRSNCYIYLHAHSAGGTNPALVEAMNLGLPIIAYSSGYNEETTENKAIYFSSKEDLLEKLYFIEKYNLDAIRIKMKEIAQRRYKWEIIAKKYKLLFEENL